MHHPKLLGTLFSMFRLCWFDIDCSVKDILGNTELKTRHYEKEEEEQIGRDRKELKRVLEAKEEEKKGNKKGKVDVKEEDPKMDSVAALQWLEQHNPDADESSSSDSDSSDGEDEEEEEALLRELEKIREERAKEAVRKQEAMVEQEQMEQREAAQYSNPLLAPGTQTVSKKWYEDTVFRHQAKNVPKQRKTFVNDTIRSDFHRKFLDRFIK